MIYTLTLNPALDYDMYLSDNLKEEDINTATEVNYRAGGKGINVSKVLRALDVESTAWGFTAGFVGNYIQQDLQKDKIYTDFIELEGNTRINVKLSVPNKEIELSGVSPFIPEEKQEELLKKVDLLQDGDILVLSGSIPASMSGNFYKTISERALSQGKDITIVLDTRGNLLEANMHGNFFIKPNIHELRDMFGEALETKEEIIAKCDYFLSRGIENVVISMGGDGALLVNTECALEAKAPAGKLINSIGAGDSMVAGFIAAYVKGMSLADAFKMGVAAGSATAYSYGLADKEGVRALFEKIELRKYNR